MTIIDLTQTKIERDSGNIQSFYEISDGMGRAERSYGWEYMILSNDQETTGYPIEPIVSWYQIPYTNWAYLIDNAGIIWTRREGIFVRHCKRASLAYIITYFGSSESKHIDEISSEQHNMWCLAAGESDDISICNTV